MFEKIKRKLSRTKSISEPLPPKDEVYRHLSLSPSYEALIARLNVLEQPRPQVHLFPTHDLNQEELNQKRSVLNDFDLGLLSLPTEILLVLQTYLRPSSEVALRYTCSRFFYLYSLPSFYLSGDEKFDFVCMTERDQDPTKLDRLVCGICRDIHPASSFSTDQVQRLPLERDCRQIWLCAHRMMGYEKTVRRIKAGPEAPFRAEAIEPCSRCREVVRSRSIADRPEKGTSQIDLESPRSESMLVSKISIMQRPVPSYGRTFSGGTGSYQEVFGIREVSAALQAINFRVCPHIKLGDPVMLSKFCRSCTNTQRLPPGLRGPPCISKWNKDEERSSQTRRCKGVCFDRNCKTGFMFQARESLQPDASGQRQVWLFIVIYRWLGPLLSAGSDSHWRDHTVNHEDRNQMRKAWDRWEKSNNGLMPKPNWSIALLNPDDCNLR